LAGVGAAESVFEIVGLLLDGDLNEVAFKVLTLSEGTVLPALIVSRGGCSYIRSSSGERSRFMPRNFDSDRERSPSSSAENDSFDALEGRLSDNVGLPWNLSRAPTLFRFDRPYFNLIISFLVAVDPVAVDGVPFGLAVVLDTGDFCAYGDVDLRSESRFLVLFFPLLGSGVVLLASLGCVLVVDF
jgi:hypothetical protein